jgi:hypothetical protein
MEPLCAPCYVSGRVPLGGRWIGLALSLALRAGQVIFVRYFPSLIRAAGYDPVAMLERLHLAGYEISLLGELEGDYLNIGGAGELGVYPPESLFRLAAFTAMDLIITKRG